MFKEQLHTAFDTISPSTELLDRISAMMSEEAGKKKASLHLNVVKYGGIAAAVALAAGGTLLVINNSNRSIGTDVTNSTAPTAERSMIAESGMTEGASYDSDGTGDDPEDAMDAEMFSIDSLDAGGEDGDNVMDALAAPEEKESADEEPESGDMRIASEESVAAGYAESDGTSDTAADEADCEEAAPVQDNSIAPEAVEDVMPDDDSDYDNGSVDSSAVKIAGSADAATGIIGTDPFLDPYTYSLTLIPDQLMDLVDGVRSVDEDGIVIYGEKWYEYVNAVFGGEYDDRTRLEDGLNIYSFIQYFEIPTGDARTALYDAADTGTGGDGITLTREEADIILTMDAEQIAAAFATPEAIVKGDRIYTPEWLLNSPPEAYGDAGITKDDILAKYDLLTTMAERYSDAVISEETQTELTAKLDAFLGS